MGKVGIGTDHSTEALTVQGNIQVIILPDLRPLIVFYGLDPLDIKVSNLLLFCVGTWWSLLHLQVTGEVLHPSDRRIKAGIAPVPGKQQLKNIQNVQVKIMWWSQSCWIISIVDVLTFRLLSTCTSLSTLPGSQQGRGRRWIRGRLELSHRLYYTCIIICSIWGIMNSLHWYK